MFEDDFKPNSHRSKGETEDTDNDDVIESVVHGTVKFRKKSTLQKLVEAVIQEDSRSIKTYILEEVVAREIASAITTIINDSLAAIFNQKVRRNRRGNSRHVPYDDYWDDREYRRDRDRRRDDRQRSSIDIDDMIFETRGEAEKVKARMLELLRRKKLVTVAAAYSFAGRKTQDTDFKFGWTDLSDVRVKHVRDGFWLILPRPFPID